MLLLFLLWTLWAMRSIVHKSTGFVIGLSEVDRADAVGAKVNGEDAILPGWAEAVQPIAQLLATFPVNLLFGAAVSGVLTFNLNTNIWLSFLIIFGTQWYIVFNVIGGAAAFPEDLREAATNFGVHGWRWWRSGYPSRHRAVLSDRRHHSIRRRVERLDRRRIREVEGSYRHRPGRWLIYRRSDRHKGDFPKILLGVGMMSIFVALLKRLFSQRLYAYAERRLRL